MDTWDTEEITADVKLYLNDDELTDEAEIILLKNSA